MSSPRDLLLALDAGTGAGRAVLFGTDGRLVAEAYEEWSYRPVDGLPLAQEFDPEAMWSVFLRLCRRVVEQAGASSDAILGVSTTSQRGGFVFFDVQGEALYGGPNLDQRPLVHPLLHDSDFLARLVRVTGQGLRPARLITRLLWFKEARPDLFARVACVLGLNDWLIFKLTGQRRAEPSHASFTALFDIARAAWSAELLDALGLPQEIFPPVSWPGEVQGGVSEEAALAVGLRPGTPVVTGLGDTQAALLGCDAVEPGSVVAVAGTTTPLQAVIDRPAIHPTGLTWTACYNEPGRWVIEANCGLTGLALRWLRDLFGERDYAFVEQALDEVEPGSGGLFNYLGPRPPGAHVLAPGWLDEVAVHGTNRAGRGELTRSLCESIAYAVRANLDLLAEMTGSSPGRLVWTGGMAKNRRLVQLVATVIGRPVDVCLGEASARGIAACAAAGAGAAPDLRTAAERLSAPRETVEPDEAQERVFAPLYQAWSERYHQHAG
ncbi:MAG: FGGY family carbohydrate kinase [Bacteroidota bacterium]